MVVLCVLLVLYTDHLVPEGVYARVSGYRVLIVGCGEFPEDKAHGHHVLYAVVAVRGVMERSLLVNDAYGGLMRGEFHLLYVLYPVHNRRVELHGALDRCLGVKLRGEGYFKEYLLHHVGAVFALELELLATK